MTRHRGGVFGRTHIHVLMQPQVAGFALRGRAEVGPLHTDPGFVLGTIEESYGNVTA